MEANPLVIVIILALIILNGLLAMSEIAVVSARKIRLKKHAEAGDPRYRVALELAETPANFLSTVQIGITLVGILAGAFGEATIAQGLKARLSILGLTDQASEAISAGVVVLTLTYLSLVVGELAPKQIGLLYPERIAALIAQPMKWFSNLASPIVHLLNLSTKLVLRILGIQPGQDPEITEDEIKLLIDHGTELGVFEPIEDAIVDQVFRLGDQRVTALITPRPEVVWLDTADSTQDILDKIHSSSYTLFPVAEGSLDNLVGFVRSTNLLEQAIKNQGVLNIKEAIIPPLLVPESLPAYAVLERLRQSGYEIAFSVDEYGGIQGLLTLTDILEALVGELPDRGELEDPGIVRREDGSWLLDGMLPIHEFRDHFNLETLPGEEEGHYLTLGGFSMTTLGHVPKPGEYFIWKNLRVEIVDMDGKRIDKLIITPTDIAHKGNQG